MARKCSVCTHPEKDSIDILLVSGISLRKISKRFNVTGAALNRHLKNHIPLQLLKVRADQELRSAENLNEEVKLLNTKIYKVINACESRLIDEENREVYSIIPGDDDIVGFSIDDEGNKKREMSRQKTAQLLLQSCREASRLIELQVCLEFTGRLEEIEKTISERGR